MKGGKSSRGYTLVEVMIFMAVSGLMFVIAAGFINGRQAGIEFRQGVNEVNDLVRSSMNEVINGRYDSSNIGCVGGGVGAPPTVGVGSFEQGTQTGCIFFGKVLQFKPLEKAADAERFIASYTLVANRINAATNDPINLFSEARPVALTGSKIRYTEVGNGMKITGMFLCTTAACNVAPSRSIGAFGIFPGFTEGAESVSDNPQSGAQTIQIGAVNTTIFNGDNASNTVSKINTNVPALDGSADLITGSRYILICLKNGKRYGSVQIGGLSGQNLQTKANFSEVFPDGTTLLRNRCP